MIKLPNLTTMYITKNDCWGDGKLLSPVRGIMVHSTATPGVMARDFANSWNKPGIAKAVHAFVDDMDIIQCLDWNKRGWHAGTGTTGISANNDYIGFEICEPAGHYYLSGSGATMFNYNVVKNQSYFDSIWYTSVRLCAFLCEVYNLNPLTPGVIIDHSEGHDLGIASAHGDVRHWFPKHGKDMDMFREEVQHLITMDTKDNSPDTYAKGTIDWALKNGILRGDAEGDLKLHESITRQDALVFIKRTYDKHILNQ